ncbi:MAG: adenylate/guanylate cyclase domain-containing protein [Bradyrhizobium sp.]
MTGERLERRLAAVLAADVAGYDRLMAVDEEDTLARLKAIRKALVETTFATHRGRIVKTTGDGMLVEFTSAVDAAGGAVGVQRSMAARNDGVSPDTRIEFRIGLHVGDIIIDENDIFGDCVNVAVRLKGIAEPGGVCISDDAYRQIRGKVDFACDDLGPQTLKNIAEPIRAWRYTPGGHRSAPAQPASMAGQPGALALPDKPSIAVLPFQNMSGDPAQDYFADGLVEDIITALSRFKSLFVIARNSSFTYKGRVVDVRQVGRELGVRYVLEGSVRKAGSRLRITGQLIDSARGFHLWAEKFDGALGDVFELQDRVASSVAGVIDPMLLDMDIKNASDRPTADLTAYDLFLRGLPLLRAWAREPNQQAIALLEQAVERDPHYGLALASLALCHSQNVSSGWGEDAAIEKERTRAWARRAIEVAPDDPSSVTSAAGALLNIGEDPKVLKGLVDGALARNPSHAFGWLWSGWIRTASGEADLAIEHFEMSLRLDPRAARRAFHLTGIGICHFVERRFEKAAAVLDTSFRELPTYPLTMWFLAACYARMGRLSEAREFAASQAIGPGGPWLTIGQLLSNPEHRELVLSGLRLATGEEA